MIHNAFKQLKESLRYKFILIFIASTFIPIFIVTNIITYIYVKAYNEDISTMARSALSPLSISISEYLHQFEQITLSPYSNDLFLYALKLKGNGGSEADAYTMIINGRYFADQLGFIDNSRNDIANILLVKNNKCLFYTNHILNNEILNDYNFSLQGWYQKALEEKSKVLFSPPHNQDYLKIQNNVFSVSRVIMDIITKKPICVVKVDIYPNVFDRFISSINFQVPSNIILLNQDNQLVYNSGHLPLSELQTINFTSEKVRFKEKSYRLISQNIKPYNWKICVLLSDTHIESRKKTIYITSFTIFSVSLLITIIIYQLLSKGIMRRFKYLTSYINSIEANNLDAVYASKTNDELDTFGKKLNSMALKLKEYIRQEYILTIKQKNAEYKALQAQIQPHFLFNALTGFVGLNRLGEVAVLERSLMDLTSLLRYCLGEKEYTPIRNELDFINKYCTLQKLRFNERLLVEISTDEALEEYIIPKLLLQPLVENAIIHGIEPMDRECLLQIKVQRILIEDTKNVQIIICDNGAGFNAPAQINDSSAQLVGIGIRNSMDRLKICFPGSSFTIRTAPGQGTEIEINIPEGEMSYDYNNS